MEFTTTPPESVRSTRTSFNGLLRISRTLPLMAPLTPLGAEPNGDIGFSDWLEPGLWARQMTLQKITSARINGTERGLFISQPANLEFKKQIRAGARDYLTWVLLLAARGFL